MTWSEKQASLSTRGGGVTTIAQAFGSNVTAGDMIVVCSTGWSGSGALLTINAPTDTLGHTYTRRAMSAWDSGTFEGLASVHDTQNIGAGANTVTITPSRACDLSIQIYEWASSNGAIVGQFDTAAANTHTNINPTTSAITLAEAGELVIANATVDGAGTTTSAPAAGWTEQEKQMNDAGSTYFDASRTDLAAGSQSHTWTLGVSGNCGMCIAAWKEPAGAGATVMPSHPVVLSQAVARAAAW